MKTQLQRSSRARSAAFSLLELLVSMAVLSIIVLALFAMFNQTQKAMRANVQQVDTMESGRAAIDLLVGELEKARAAGMLGVNNLILRKENLYGVNLPYQATNILDVNHRDSALHSLFYLTPLQGNQWSALGWYVANPTNASRPVDENLGALYRFDAEARIVARGAVATNDFNALYPNFRNVNVRTNNSSRLMDGILFFRVLPYTASGIPIDFSTPTNLIPKGVTVGTASFPVTAFSGSAIPASLEVEIGAVPPRLLGEYRSLGNPSLQAAYLSKHTAELLVFRQRISLRTATQ
jgi:prepilin-type N-terminal cleavage/methylation domain-containing protein